MRKIVIVMALILLVILTSFCFACVSEPPAPEHTHDFVTTHHDDTHHWEQCDCGATSEKISHTFTPTHDDTHHWEQCDCGAISEKVPHTFTPTHDDTHHWEQCDCGAITEKVSHTFTPTHDDTHHWEQCDCGATSEKVPHTFTPTHDDTHHWEQCDCGATSEKISHTFVGKCTCTECGYAHHVFTQPYSFCDYYKHKNRCDVCKQIILEYHTNVTYEKATQGTHYVICEKCGTTEKYCAYSRWVNTDSGYKSVSDYVISDEGHSKICVYCGGISELVEHWLTVRCSEDEHWKQCYNCGYTCGHEAHNKNAYGYDEYCHWKACDFCGYAENIEREPHEYNKNGECKCGHHAEYVEPNYGATREPKEGEYTITFMVDGEVYHKVVTTGDEYIYLPKSPEKSENVFVNWKETEQRLWDISENSYATGGVRNYFNKYFKEPNFTLELYDEYKNSVFFESKNTYAPLTKNITVNATFLPRIESMNGEGFIFELNEDGESYAVTGMSDDKYTVISIPEKYNGLPVTKVENVFKMNLNVTELTFPDTVTDVGLIEFCPSLRKLVLSESMTEINEYIFLSGFSLKELHLSDNLTRLSPIYNMDDPLTIITFWNCMTLTRIYLPSSTKEFSLHISSYMKSLKYIYYGGSAIDWCKFDYDRSIRDKTSLKWGFAIKSDCEE